MGRSASCTRMQSRERMMCVFLAGLITRRFYRAMCCCKPFGSITCNGAAMYFVLRTKRTDCALPWRMVRAKLGKFAQPCCPTPARWPRSTTALACWGIDLSRWFKFWFFFPGPGRASRCSEAIYYYIVHPPRYCVRHSWLPDQCLEPPTKPGAMQTEIGSEEGGKNKGGCGESASSRPPEWPQQNPPVCGVGNGLSALCVLQFPRLSAVEQILPGRQSPTTLTLADAAGVCWDRDQSAAAGGKKSRHSCLCPAACLGRMRLIGGCRVFAAKLSFLALHFPGSDGGGRTLPWCYLSALPKPSTWGG